MAQTIRKTGIPADHIPSETPAMMFGAVPISLSSEMSRTGE